MADPHRSFHSATRAAQVWLAAGAPDKALEALRYAMRSANRLSPAHRRVTLRAMNWTRAAVRAAA